jgi:small GTP-binding protein
MSNYDFVFKYAIIGDVEVGKSSLLRQYANSMSLITYQSTIGVEYVVKTLNLKRKNLRVICWDTSGQEKFKSITRSYYYTAKAIFFVYDITQRKSFEDIQEWLDDVKKYCQDKLPHFVLIGNKNDLEENRLVTKQEGKTFAETNGMIFFETSAKNAQDIGSVFEQTTLYIMQETIRTSSIGHRLFYCLSSFFGMICCMKT